MVDVLCCLGGGRRLPDGFCLVQEVGLFPQHICHLLASWIPVLWMGLIAAIKTYILTGCLVVMCPWRGLITTHCSFLTSSLYVVSSSSFASRALPHSWASQKAILTVFRVENHLNHRDGRGQCVSDKEANDITYSWSGVLSFCPLSSTGVPLILREDCKSPQNESHHLAAQLHIVPVIYGCPLFSDN